MCNIMQIKTTMRSLNTLTKNSKINKMAQQFLEINLAI